MLRRLSASRGFAMAMTLIIVTLVALATFTAVNVSQLDSRASTQEYSATRALYAARAGLASTLAKLQTNYSYSGGSNLPIGNAGSETFTVTVTPAAWNGAVSSNSDNRWLLVSTGNYQGASRTLQAYANVEPFSKYAYFTDAETSGSSIIRFGVSDVISGQTHTNGYFTFAGQTQFTSQVTSANQGDSPYAPGPPKQYTYNGNQSGYYFSATTNTSQFYHYDNGQSLNSAGPIAYTDGSGPSPFFSFTGGVGAIPLPVDTGAISSNADISIANNTGHSYTGSADYQMTYDENGGINGDCTNFQKKTTGSWSNVSESSAPPVYKLVFTDSPAQVSISRKVVGSNSYQAVSGSPFSTATSPGVTIHVDGFATVSGTVKGRVTLGSTRNLHVTGNLTYSDPDVDVLGLVSKENVIVESKLLAGQDREIDASIMCLEGSFTVDKYNTGPVRGKLTVLGGLIQKVRGPVGTGNSSGLSTGYAKDYRYDSKLLSTPPLNFPTTGLVVISAIRDLGALGSQ